MIQEPVTAPTRAGGEPRRPRIEAVELIQVELPLVTPFRTSFGTQAVRRALLVHLLSDGPDGWGECVAMEEPLYSSEYVDAAEQVIERQLLPRLGDGPIDAARVAVALSPVRGHRMAKAAIEMAVLDAQLRAQGRPLAALLGATREAVDCGVSVGIMDSIPQLLDAVSGYVADGYRRIKLKIEPGWDLEPVREVRRLVGAEMPLQVDANAAYTLADTEHLARLDEFDLLLIEQPLPEEQILAHAHLARAVRTPICLDESIVSVEVAAEAIELGACSIINIKPGRVGGYLEARRIHDLCVDRGIPVWCGGMLETGIGRAANVALAALPGFTLPGDTSASGRYYAQDLTAPFVLQDGRLPVPTAPGLGVEVLRSVVDSLTISRRSGRPA